MISQYKTEKQLLYLQIAVCSSNEFQYKSYLSSIS